ncbi:MAG TPA: XRE family transcriptional regulator [bacterium (Candidatus Stahlbacteria)]|nr:XRE family transcriptional regulator [Candidatus Stahlbacteria bacterium]
MKLPELPEGVAGLGQRVRYVRKKILAMTQQEFGKLIGVTQDTVSRYETNKANLSVKQLAKIAETAEVSLDWLITGKEKFVKRGKRVSPISLDLASRVMELEKRLDKLERKA